MIITVNMHQAKSRLSALVKSVERGETVIVQRNGVPVAEIVAHRPAARRRLTFAPHLKPVSIGYDPTEPLQPDELPEVCR